MASGAHCQLSTDIQMHLTLAGGDDYELVFTAPVAKRQAIAAASALSETPVTRIGKIRASRELLLLNAQGLNVAHTFQSFDHFKTP
jgi:thiamine-monophosphate kinase